MSPTEAVHLVAYIVARCPQQRLEAATADVWYDDLAPIDVRDATEAVRRITKRQPFCSLADLLGEVRLIGNERADAKTVRELDGPAQRVPMPPEVREQMDRLFRLPRDVAGEARRAAVTVACPWCHVPAGAACESGGRRIGTVHEARVETGMCDSAGATAGGEQ